MILKLEQQRFLEMSNKNSGLSLVELVCAVAILATSVLMLVSCYHGVSQMRVKTLVYSNMQMVCKNIYEEIRATNEVPSVNYNYVYDGVKVSVEFVASDETVPNDDISYYEVTFYSEYLGTTGNKRYRFIVPTESVSG